VSDDRQSRARAMVDEHLRPLAPGLSWYPDPQRTRGAGLPWRNNSTVRSGGAVYFRAGRCASCHRTAIPHLHCVPVGGVPWPDANQGSAGSRPSSPRPSGQRVAPGGAPHRPHTAKGPHWGMGGARTVGLPGDRTRWPRPGVRGPAGAGAWGGRICFPRRFTFRAAR
jgi:hypothetical protein